MLRFEPWFAEEAMTAGVNPDRAISKAFEESCAAVFFITPSFKDETWLADEIEYARREKREKKERFQIISLVFKDRRGKKGVVPKLLASYIYKEPETHLEALREIIRALPVSVGMVDWQDRTIITSAQAQAIKEMLDESKLPAYTNAKRIIAEWADKHPGAFQPNQILGPTKFGLTLQHAWEDYDSDTNRSLQESRGVFNKFWDRLVERFEANQFSYHIVFDTIGDNLWLLSITQPLEILLARFSSWVESDPGRRSTFAQKGFRVGEDALIWTQMWPWRK